MSAAVVKKSSVIYSQTHDLEVVDFMSQPDEAKFFATSVTNICKARRQRLGKQGYFDTHGDAILTAYLAGFKAGKGKGIIYMTTSESTRGFAI